MGSHLFTAGHQPATRFNVGDSDLGDHIITYPDRSPVYASCCKRKRWAVYCTVQVYYDCLRFWCRHGMGCKRGAR